MGNSNRQKTPLKTHGDNALGALWVVATPIGNLGDFSLRARECLERADGILCEDTRQGAKLLAALGVAKSLSSLRRLDAHSTPGALREQIDRVTAGENLALITDAGTPAISDPGSALVALALQEGISVVPVPGPSAVPALLSVCGFGETAFTFRGFFPRKSADREKEITLAVGSPASRVFVWFESPQRVSDALKDFARVAPGARVVAAKELTKLHERIFSGSAGEVSAEVSSEISREGELGEWVFAACFEKMEEAAAGEKFLPESEVWMKTLQCLVDAGVPASGAARQVSQSFGAPKKIVYDLALRIAGKISGKKSDQGG